MVCKENVVSWFGNLSSYKRIDVMCTLLNMCLPFEVRYLGTCVEDLGKRDYNDLRETENRANNAADLAELTTLGVTDKRTRRKLALYMALLHSCNYACAVILYKNLSNIDFQELVSLLNGNNFSENDQPLEELLLLYTMALNHPAFTYEQKSVFGNIYVKLQEEETRLNPPKPASNSTHKSPQACTPGVTPNERVAETEVPVNCPVPPPPMQPFHGDMSMRNATMVSGVPPGLTMPPPGLCLPPEQMAMSTGATAQYVHVGFPSMNHMTPWPGQVMMSNPLMYHTGEMLAYPPSPLVSRQSSPSQSRSPSRSNSPMSRRSNALARTSSQVTQSISNTLTTSTSTSNSQTNISSSNATPLPPLPSLNTSRSLPTQSPLPPQRSAPPPTTVAQSRHNSIDNTPHAAVTAAPSKQPPPPPRLRSSTAADSLRETLGKEMPNFKPNLQNFSIDEIRRMSDEELRDLGLPSNAVGQLRSIVKGQAANGLNQLSADKKQEVPSGATHHILDHTDNEAVRVVDVMSEGSNAATKCIPLQQQQQQQQVLHHHHNHGSTNIRRYPTIPPMEPTQMPIYPPQQHMYTAQNTPCFACLTMPVTGVQNRYPRCNAQHVYCLTQLQALRLDPEGSRHCSQSSSSESTGSRSPPETPPAAPWVGSGEGSAPPTTDHPGSTPLHSNVPVSHTAPQPMQPLPEKHRNSKRNPTHVVRHKNHMVNGGPPSLQPCVPFHPPPSHSPVHYLPHGHFPSLRPATGIYSSFSQAYARPTYPTYQPNGEMMYQYPGAHPGHPASGGTPPPLPTAGAPAQTAYLPPTPVVTYSPAVPPPKVSCYNCGSSNHHAADCKDQTMEDLTKRGQYRLDYTILKQPGECPSSDK